MPLTCTKPSARARAMSRYGSVARRTSATISSAERVWAMEGDAATGTSPATTSSNHQRIARPYHEPGPPSTRLSVSGQRGADVVLEEIHDGLRERVVLITRHHVGGPTDVDELG